MAEIKAKVLEDEITTPAEKEKEVLKDKMTLFEKDEVIKVDLSKNKQEKDAVQEQSTDEVSVRNESETSGEVQEENTKKETKESASEKEEEEINETPIIEEITDETTETNNTNEAGVDGSDEVANSTSEQEEVLPEEKTQEPEVNLPENIQDLVKFMEETGGSLEDYVRLSADYSNVEEETLLVEYYKQTKPHLSYEEIQFLMEDKFSIDEELDSDRDVRRKKLARKEEIAQAKNFLTSMKDKYYKEVKLGSKLLPEQQKAIDFFNRYNTEQKSAEQLLEKQTKHFKQQTENVFNENFKGFNFKVGDKKYRFNVKDVNKVKESQNLSNVFDKYVDENNLLTQANDFHKALFAASNSDAIANHFYEQGKADAIKQMAADAKNINMNPRKTADGYVESGGIKVRAISGDDNSKLKLKLKNY